MIQYLIQFIDNVNMKVVQQVLREVMQQAQQAEVDFALGNMTNTHELGVYQQQANIALQYTVAIRDKALEAYKEIMNMQI